MLGIGGPSFAEAMAGKEVVPLLGIKHQIIQLLFGDDMRCQPVLDQQIFTQAVITIGTVRRIGRGKVTDIIPTLGPHPALGLEGTMKGHLAEMVFAYGVGLAFH